jgi:hypothetical protein
VERHSAKTRFLFLRSFIQLSPDTPTNGQSQEYSRRMLMRNSERSAFPKASAFFPAVSSADSANRIGCAIALTHGVKQWQ